jgi:type I restriction enzyme, R subunit
MATGSGKTFTAVSAVYRLIKFAGARRVSSTDFAA